MPYNRGYKKQNGFGKTPWKNGKQKANMQYRQAQSRNYRAMLTTQMNARTAGYMGLEKKFVDYRVDDDQFTNVWAGGEMEDPTALSVSAVAQGDGESQRDGRVYYIHGIYITGTINRPAAESQANPVGDEIARLCLVWDKQTNGAQLNAEDVMLTIAAGDDVDSYRNLQSVQRFKVLADKKYRVAVTQGQVNEGAVNLFANGATTTPFKLSYTFKTPIKVSCSGTTAAIASITDNSLHVIGTSNNGAATLSYTSRLRFTG